MKRALWFAAIAAFASLAPAQDASQPPSAEVMVIVPRTQLVAMMATLLAKNARIAELEEENDKLDKLTDVLLDRVKVCQAVMLVPKDWRFNL